MAKKSSAKPKVALKKPTKRFRPAREHVIMAILAIIGIFALSYFAFTQYQISQEKKAFADAEVVLAQLSEDIEAKLGAPISSETTKQCAYASAKYVKGGPRCSVSTSLKYKYSASFAEEIKNGANSAFVKSNSVVVNGGDLSRVSQYGSISNDFTIIGNSMSCGTSVSAIPDDSNNITIDFSCYKDTKKEYFPVKE